MKNFEDEDPIEIPLERGLVAWVSQEDADLACMGWRMKKTGRSKFPAYYAVYQTTIAGVSVQYFLHDMVWERMSGNAVPKKYGYLVDHINGDKLNCCRSNLRLATRTQNEANKKKRRSNTTSKYKGVSKIEDGRKKCWRACISVRRKLRTIGTYYTEVEAAKAYNEEAKKEFGEFAFLNTFEDEKQ